MSLFIASRVAAARLAWIVGVLLIPIFMLGYFLFSQLQEDIEFNRKEAGGIKLVGLIAPAFLDAASGKYDSANYEKLLVEGPAAAESINARGEFEQIRKALSQDPVDPKTILKLSHRLILQVGELSNLILDPEPESYYLAAASTQGIPNLVAGYKNLQTVAAKTIKQNDPKSLAMMSSANGQMLELSKVVGSAVNSAKSAARRSFDYVPLLASLDSIRKSVDRRAQDIEGSFDASASDFMALKFGITAMSNGMLSDYAALWRQINSRFETLIANRHQALNRKMSVAVITSFMAMLIGLGSAIAMFQSTLKRLDEISRAKESADEARVEAEDMADKLTVINSDMALMNRELGSQMHMLKEAQDALVSKGRMEQLGQLTATIAHELRNPLGAVRTSAFLIERKIKGKELGFESQLARINNGVSRCDDIITQLLDFSRSRPLAARPADLDDWLAKTVEEEARQLPAVVAIECVLNLQGQEVPFDPARLQRAIINLLSNASEAMVGKGDDPSRFETKIPCIVVRTDLQNGFAVISIKDNGPGISIENLEKIREPLFTTKSFGTGLGLPAVEQIVTQHSGRFEVNSKLGAGAEFVIYLPLNLSSEAAA